MASATPNGASSERYRQTQRPITTMAISGQWVAGVDDRDGLEAVPAHLADVAAHLVTGWALAHGRSLPSLSCVVEVAGRGEFVAEVVERIRLAVFGGGQGGPSGGDQVVIAAANDCRDGVEVVDLVAQRRDRGERTGEDAAGCGSQPDAGERVRPR